VQTLPRTPLRIRRWRTSDEAFISDLGARAFAEYDAHSAATTLRLARLGSTWLALRAAEPLGFAIVHSPNSHRAELCAIAVAEAARGSGVGAALLAEVERALLREGTRSLHLHTAQANLSAMELFLKRGFRIEARLPRFYRGVFDACAMSKRLGQARG